MKNLKYFIIPLILIFIFSSCSIEKRRYLKGYHISSSKRIGNSGKSKTTIITSSDSVETQVVEQEKIDPELSVEELTYTSEVETNDSFIADEKVEPVIKAEPVNLVEDKAPSVNQGKNKIVPKSSSSKKHKKDKKEKAKFHLSKRNIAIIIGISLLLMALIAIPSTTVISAIFVLGNPIQTGINMAANSAKFIGAIVGWIGILILDFIVSWGVYKYYKKNKSKIAAASGILRAIYSLFLVGAIVQLFLASVASSSSLIYSFLNMFNSVWGWGLIVFGLHLILLGILYDNEGGKKWVNILIKVSLIIAGIGYLIGYIGILFVPNPVAFSATITSIFMLFMILGEVAFAIWMLVKGGKR